jgi:Tfp pilus assembly protein PilV
MSRTATRSRQRGFTLVEAALTTVIVGVGVVAVVELLATGTRANIDSYQQTTAVNLIKNVREICARETFAEIQTMNNTAWSPPRDGSNEPIAGMSDWRQRIAVQGVDINRLTLDVPTTTASAVRVTITVEKNSVPVASESYIAVRPN